MTLVAPGCEVGRIKLSEAIDAIPCGGPVFNEELRATLVSMAEELEEKLAQLHDRNDNQSREIRKWRDGHAPLMCVSTADHNAILAKAREYQDGMIPQAKVDPVLKDIDIWLEDIQHGDYQDVATANNLSHIRKLLTDTDTGGDTDVPEAIPLYDVTPPGRSGSREWDTQDTLGQGSGPSSFPKADTVDDAPRPCQSCKYQGEDSPCDECVVTVGIGNGASWWEPGPTDTPGPDPARPAEPSSETKLQALLEINEELAKPETAERPSVEARVKYLEGEVARLFAQGVPITIWDNAVEGRLNVLEGIKPEDLLEGLRVTETVEQGEMQVLLIERVKKLEENDRATNASFVEAWRRLDDLQIPDTHGPLLKRVKALEERIDLPTDRTPPTADPDARPTADDEGGDQ